MADESTGARGDTNPDAKLREELPLQEYEQHPDPAASPARVGPAGLTLFALVAIGILTVVLIGLNGPNETPGSASGTPAKAGAAAAPAPAAPQNGAGAKP